MNLWCRQRTDFYCERGVVCRAVCFTSVACSPGTDRVFPYFSGFWLLFVGMDSVLVLDEYTAWKIRFKFKPNDTTSYRVTKPWRSTRKPFSSSLRDGSKTRVKELSTVALSNFIPSRWIKVCLLHVNEHENVAFSVIRWSLCTWQLECVVIGSWRIWGSPILAPPPPKTTQQAIQACAAVVCLLWRSLSVQMGFDKIIGVHCDIDTSSSRRRNVPLDQV